MTDRSVSPKRFGGRRHSRRDVLQIAAPLTAAGLVPVRRAIGDSRDADIPLDFEVADGHHYRQATGTEAGGYEVRNLGPLRWWDIFRRLGGPGILGYPVSRLYRRDGFALQLLQFGLLQASGDAGGIEPANLLQILDRAGLVEWLLHFKGVPPPIPDDGGQSFDESVRIRLSWLTDDAIRARFERNPDPVRWVTWRPLDAQVRWGLPMSFPARMGPFVAQRFQRGVLQRWVEPVAGLPRPGTVTAAFVGEFLVEAGLVPASARQPIDSTQARAAARETVGDRLHAAITARVATEPGRWAVVVGRMGEDEPLVALNADTVMPAASLWKVAAMLEAFRQRAAGGLRFGELLTMTKSVLSRVVPPASLVAGQHIPVHHALAEMMRISDNTAAILLGDRLGYRQIDQTLRDLGLRLTTVNAQTTLTTAREIAVLLNVAVGGRRAAWDQPLADALRMRELLLSETRRDRIPAQLPPDTPVAHKTGQFGAVLNDAGVVYASTGVAGATGGRHAGRRA